MISGSLGEVGVDMFDVTFIDIPNMQINDSSELKTLLTNYYNSCNKITKEVTGYEVMEKPFNYTLGFLCLSSYIKKNGFKVGYLNMNTDGENFEYIVKQSRVICFSPMTITIKYIVKLIKDVKLVNSAVKIIVGGYHASYMIEELFEECVDLDLIIIGEGERQLVNYLRGVELKEINGIAYREFNEVIINELETYIDESEIPVPDFSLISDKLDMFNIHISTMRGCIGKCHFCVNSNYWGKPRLIELDKIQTEIMYLNSNLPAGTLIHFSDNVFTYDKKRFIELSKVIGNFGEKLIYECDTLSSLIDEEIVRRLDNIKVVKIHLGFEDCVDGILRIANKSVSYSQNLNAIDVIAQVSEKMCICAYWLIGLPGANKQTMLRNRMEIERLLLKKQIHIVSPKVFIPYPGTFFWNNAEKVGMKILNHNWEEYERRCPPFPYELECLSSEEMYEELKNVMYMCENIYNKR